MEEGGWVYRIAQLLNLWEIRAAVFSSFVAHLLLILLAGVRRRRASGVRMLILWVAYQLSSWVAPYALSNLSLCGNTSRSQQLVAFWATFLLHHLGGPDNISAFSLEDNKLSGREALNVGSRIALASYVLYKHVYLGSGEALISASIIIFVLGVAKYVERALALWRADLGKICSSGKKKQADTRFFTACAGSEYQINDEEALMVAHDMLPFCKRAMADSSFDTGLPDDHDLETSRRIFTLRWENMCNVVEMELSLVYDILYTKAAVVHTSVGYAIRVASPLAIGAATVLFGFYYSKEGQSIPDVVMTYALLLATLLLDTRWLLRALGSTWARAFLRDGRPRQWLHHAVLCSGRWRRLRQFVVYLDLGWLSLTHPWSPSSYRKWSGTVGKYNLLQECGRKISACGRTVKAIGLEDVWNEYQHSQGHKLSRDVKQAVFTRVREVLWETCEKKEDNYTMKDITTSWGQVTKKRHDRRCCKIYDLAFGREFQEDILVWHIATQVFLICSHSKLIAHDKNVGMLAKAIKAMSEYLMFLIAVRPSMLPGLALRSLYEVTLMYLQELDTSCPCSSSTAREEKLAEILVDKRKQEDMDWGSMHDKSSIAFDGANLAIVLLEIDESEMPELLELVFNVWVDKLLYATTRCSPESHAKQLSRGGDLTTIIWIMAQHAGPFIIGQPGPDAASDEEPEPELVPEQEPEMAMKPAYPPEMAPPPLPPPPMAPPPPRPAPRTEPQPPKRRRDRRRRYATLYPVY